MGKQDFNVCTVLRELAEEYCAGDKSMFDNVLLVGMQHILETTVDMFAVMKEYGLTDAVIGGKKYSTHQKSAKKIEPLGYTYISDGYQLGYGRFDDCMQEVVHRIWSAALEKIKSKKYSLMIILDDGADLLRATPGVFFNGLTMSDCPNRPEMIIGIEQTRGGTNHPLFSGLPFPIIDVAGSFVKTKLEYPKVAEIVAQKVSLSIEQLIFKEIKSEPVIGIVGYGAMGKAVAKQFTNLGYSVIVYEKDVSKRSNQPKVTHYEYLSVLIANADVIIGCSGKDVTSENAALSALLFSRQKKWLISTGSKDLEFNSLLHTIQNETKGMGYVPDPFRSVRYENRVGAVIEIVRGGFPINFSNEAHSIQPEFIWPTRGALMLACLSAVYMRRNHFKRYSRKINIFMLPVDAQLVILKKYSSYFSNQKDVSRICSQSDYKIKEFLVQSSDGIGFNVGLRDVPINM